MHKQVASSSRNRKPCERNGEVRGGWRRRRRHGGRQAGRRCGGGRGSHETALRSRDQDALPSTRQTSPQTRYITPGKRPT
ncbi:hypothetical protein E2C01_025748 [Portunus trituberculatus]|uniref:Uncharacterized protein n=1 Tax=Portunus trituberculatus TaxID=210409 RepID=A0A5B7EGK0_PORTR|nr:hypothetical protein [Portunus trituberculatus]